LLRVNAAAVVSSVGGALPVEAGAGVFLWWLRSPVSIGVGYAFFPGAVVDGGDASVLVTRHVVAAAGRGAWRVGAWELSVGAGPLLEVWRRTTRSTSATSTASDGATLAAVGGFARAGALLFLSEHVGLDAGLALELVPFGPEFRGASGAAVLVPSVVRGRGEAGVAFELP
jgi:hypothetical protein